MPAIRPSPVSTVNTARFEVLDILRGLAALAVCLYHFTSKEAIGIPGLDLVLGQGYLGVYAFFVISGFVIPLSLQGTSLSQGNWRRFLARRFLRLYPAYVVAIVVTVLLWYGSTCFPGFAGHGPDLEIVNLLANLTLSADWLGQPWMLVVSWTLAIEAQYYVAIALFLTCFKVAQPRMRIVILAVWVLAPLVFDRGDLVTAFAAVFGMGIALYAKHCGLISGRVFWWTLMIATAVQFGSSCAWTENGLQLHSPVGWMSGLIGLMTVAAIRVGRNWRFRPLVWLGKISYSLYLVHVPIGGRVVNLSSRLTLTAMGHVAVVTLACAASILVAWGFYRWVELPSHRWARRIRLRE